MAYGEERAAQPAAWLRPLGSLPWTRHLCRLAGCNVDGKRVPQRATSPTNLQIMRSDCFAQQKERQVVFLYLSHKAVHADFGAPRKNTKASTKIRNSCIQRPWPISGEYAQHRPTWVHNQRNSWHGVEYPYHSESQHRRTITKRIVETLGPGWTIASAWSSMSCYAADLWNRHRSFTWATTALHFEKGTNRQAHRLRGIHEGSTAWPCLS